MDSGDEFDDALLGIGVPEHKRYRWISRDIGHLRLHEDEIREYLTRFHSLPRSERTQERYEQARHMLWSFHEDRFFDTLKGYHEGNCDLTGRHPERYTRLRNRFDDLSGQFDKLLSRATLVSGDETWGSGENAFVTKWHQYEFEDPQEWEAFAKRWHAPFRSAYRLMDGLKEVKDTFAEHPMPRFQKIMLLDLPVEILENIAEHCASSTLRQLYATCRQLRLLALTDVYTKCTFFFSAEFDWRQAAVLDDNGVSLYLREQIDKQRTSVLRHMDSLRQRPDALDRTKEIAFYDTWTCDVGSSLGEYARTGRTVEQLLLPLLSRLSFFIFRCPVELVHFKSQEFPGIIWDAARSSSSLRTLIINARVQEDPHNWLPAPSLTNLHLFLQNGTGLRMWDILPLCPNLKYLSFRSIEQHASRVPASIASPTNIFHTLTRIVLRGIQARSVRVLIQALNDAAAAVAPDSLPLTHFRLDLKCSLLKRDAAFHLIDALSRASIRALYINQLQYARPQLLEHIATSLPLLEALTLRHQQRDLADDRISIEWPCPAYEYALALRGFPKLSIFCFNNKLWRIAYTSFYLADFEEEWAHAEEKMEAAWDEWLKFCARDKHQAVQPQDVAFHPEDCDYFGDSVSDILPRLFATYCPTLHLLHTGWENWAFDRRADGKIVARTHKDLTPAEHRYAGMMYDSFDYENWNV